MNLLQCWQKITPKRFYNGPDAADSDVQTLIDFPETGGTIDDFLAVYPAIPGETPSRS
jgi:hypothetical protein